MKKIYIRKINLPHGLAEVKASELIMTKSSIVVKSAEQDKKLDVKTFAQMKSNNVSLQRDTELLQSLYYECYI